MTDTVSQLFPAQWPGVTEGHDTRSGVRSVGYRSARVSVHAHHFDEEVVIAYGEVRFFEPYAQVSFKLERAAMAVGPLILSILSGLGHIRLPQIGAIASRTRDTVHQFEGISRLTDPRHRGQ